MTGLFLLTIVPILLVSFVDFVTQYNDTTIFIKIKVKYIITIELIIWFGRVGISADIGILNRIPELIVVLSALTFNKTDPLKYKYCFL